ncbi:MAG: fibrinogen-related protein [Sphingomonas sp.]|jgi:hypothetical protein|uniref:fibrinogen-related protein n=1 Tax=Sphingomonas sp. TaxID=28214 RepID=UPI003567915E
MLRTIAPLCALLICSVAEAQVPAAPETKSVPREALNTRASPLNQSCGSMAGKQNAKSGFYWVTLDDEHQVLMYCNNDTTFDNLKGGWTLVWSNLRGGRGKLVSDLHWGASIETLPRYRGAMITQASQDLQSFEVFTGLRWWRRIIDAGKRREMAYVWAHNYGDLNQVDRQAGCQFDLVPTDGWMITFKQASCKGIAGTTELPELFTNQGGNRWSTIDQDNDKYPGSCASLYGGGAPWWYHSCWSGSISGGGELADGGQSNGAYWKGMASKWGEADGTGAGNGWLYIR